jgi:hypothetical protein
MLLELRYHIWSLIAVFLALALGVLVGVGLVADPVEMGKLVERVREDNERTREYRVKELERLKARERNFVDFAKAARAALVKGRLEGVRLAIVLDHEFPQDPIGDDVRAVLAQAGAKIASMTTITRAFTDLDPGLGEETARALGIEVGPEQSAQVLLARELADSIAAGWPGAIGTLKEKRLIRCSGDSDFDRPVGAVLLVSGLRREGEASPEHIDLPLVRRLTERGVRVVACEREQARVSLAPVFKSAGISTVDNVDTEAGHVAAVYALAGEQGNFGVKLAADRLLPELGAAPSR